MLYGIKHIFNSFYTFLLLDALLTKRDKTTMIKTRKELKLYIKLDYIMNYGEYSLKERIYRFLSFDLVARYLKTLRKSEYYSNKKNFLSFLNNLKFKKLSYKTGIIISKNVFGYGLVIPHHGTIVVGEGNKIGNYCVLHTSTCITAGQKQIGDFFYMSVGSKVINDITIPNGVSLGANSVLNKKVDKENSLYGGIPATYICQSEIWVKRDGEKYKNRYKKCESIIKEYLRK